jgi:hypothetical protein
VGTLTQGREVPAVAVIGTELVVFGGDSNVEFQTRSVETYDFSTRSWTTRTSLLSGTTYSTAATVDGKLYSSDLFFLSLVRCFLSLNSVSSCLFSDILVVVLLSRYTKCMILFATRYIPGLSFFLDARTPSTRLENY